MNMTIDIEALTAFITARLDQDEAAAKAATAGQWHAAGEDVLLRSSHPYWDGACVANATGADAAHIVRHDPPRELRAVAAIRTIIEEFYLDAFYPVILTHLAAIWSDDPDYKEEWKR